MLRCRYLRTCDASATARSRSYGVELSEVSISPYECSFGGVSGGNSVLRRVRGRRGLFVRSCGIRGIRCPHGECAQICGNRGNAKRPAAPRGGRPLGPCKCSAGVRPGYPRCSGGGGPGYARCSVGGGPRYARCSELLAALPEAPWELARVVLVLDVLGLLANAQRDQCDDRHHAQVEADEPGASAGGLPERDRDERGHGRTEDARHVVADG